MKKKVVLLEDDEAIREMIEYLLLDEQFEVSSYSRAGRFMRNLRNEKADLFLLDIMLADGNGIDICYRLKGSEETRHTPIIMMSAHYDLNMMENIPAEDFIKKPFDIDDFLWRVQKQLFKFAMP